MFNVITHEFFTCKFLNPQIIYAICAYIANMKFLILQYPKLLKLNYQFSCNSPMNFMISFPILSTLFIYYLLL